jgi:hypothetical protein
MTTPRIIDFEKLTDEECDQMAERLRSRRAEAAYILQKAQETYKQACSDYDWKMLAINESRKVADTKRGSRLIKKLKDEPLPRRNSNNRGMD